MPSFGLAAFIQYGFVDDIADTKFVAAPTGLDAIRVITDFSSFTADANDPQVLRDYSRNSLGSYSGWIGIEVTVPTVLRIYHQIEADGMEDTLLGIWGPQATPPGPSDDPWHFSDDSIPGEALGSLHDVGGDPLGTLWVGGDPYSEDDQESGIALAPGQYWVATAPYRDDIWDTSEGPVRLVIQRTPPSFSLDAVITKTQPGITRPATPQYIASTQAANWGQPSIVGNRPTGVQDGDLLVALVSGNSGGSGEYFVTSPGWTDYAKIAQTFEYLGLFVLTKVASSEPSSWTFSWSTGTGSLAVSVICIRDGEVVGVSGKAIDASTPATTSHTTALLDAIARSIVLAAFANAAYGPTTTWTLDGALTEITDVSSFFSGLGVGYEDVAAPETVQYSATSSNATWQVNALLNVAGAAVEGLLLDAYIAPYFAIGAYIGPSPASVPGYLTLRAQVVAPRFALEAYIVQHVFSLEAVIANGALALDAVVLATRPTRLLTLNAFIEERGFGLDAVITPGPPVERSGLFYLRAWKEAMQSSGGFSLDAVMDSAIGLATFTIDAIYVEPTRTGSFAISSEISAAGEERGLIALDSTFLRVGGEAFSLDAYIAQLTLQAWIAGALSLDAVIAYVEGSGDFDMDAVLKGVSNAALTADAIIADAAGDFRQSNLDAVLLATVTPYGGIEVLAHIAGTMARSFALDAVLNAAFGVDAFVQPYFSLGAYIEGTSVVVYPPSQDGGDGTSTDGTTFTSPSADFDDSLIGQQITVDGVDYIITGVTGSDTLTVSGGLPFGQNDLVWSIPSGDPTDPLGGDVPITRKFRVNIEWSRPNRNVWTDITGDVMWRRTKFTQSARVGPGTFELHLLGTFDQFVGGEEVRVSVDDFRVFGGFVLEIEYAYAFEDDYSVPLTILHGVDYNVVLDRRLVYNAEWDEQQGGDGEYKPWKPFAKGTSDREIITTIARRFSDVSGFDFITGVDEIETPAPVKGWTMEPGSTWRTVLAEICRITEGVFWISPYKRLEYHDRGDASAPYPITDGNGGISCRGLSISSSMSVVTNDVFAWGTEAYMDTGDSDIIFSRQTADADWEADWWATKIDRVDTRLANLRETPYSDRTKKQQTTIAALKKSSAVYEAKLAAAQAHPSDGSVERIGRWQYAEFRQDIYHQNYLDRRAAAIMQRYAQPVVKARATVFDPGFQAGQVAQVVSTRFGVVEDIAIREMTIDFVVAKEPEGGRYYAVPRYHLNLGLDPEEPWNIYEYLPFPDTSTDNDDPYTNYNPHHVRIPGIDNATEAAARVLDSFTRASAAGDTWGVATSERSETREWRDSLVQSFIIFADDFQRMLGPSPWPEANAWGSPWLASNTGGHPGTLGVDGSRGYIAAPVGSTLQARARTPVLTSVDPAGKWTLYFEAEMPPRSASPGSPGLPNTTSILINFSIDDADENTVYETGFTVNLSLETYLGAPSSYSLSVRATAEDSSDYETANDSVLYADPSRLEAPLAVRAEMDASGIRAKAWPLGDSEPSGWEVDAPWSVDMLLFPPDVEVPAGHTVWLQLSTFMNAFDPEASYLDNIEWARQT